jgi:hypothetical protein
MCFNAGAETVQRVEGNMSGAARRGPVALPGSETRSRTKGTRRNLGDLISPMAARSAVGHDGKSRRRSRRGRGEESDDCIVPGKPRTKPISRIGGGDGGGKAVGRRKGEQRRTHRTQGRILREPEAARLRIEARMGRPSPDLRSRSTSGRSPVRESRPLGSERGDRGNPAPYRDRRRPGRSADGRPPGGAT